MKKIRKFWVGLCCLALATTAFGMKQHQLTKNQAPSKPPYSSESLKKYPPKTELSQKALKLKVGMSKAEVLAILGPPTWADSYSGEPLALSWKNGNCNPVVVTFDKTTHVNGYDEGRAYCQSTEYTDVPDDSYLCTKDNIKALCE